MTPRTQFLASIPLIVYTAYVSSRLVKKSGPVPKFVTNWSRSGQLIFVWTAVALFFVVLIPAASVLVVDTLGPEVCPGHSTDPWRCSTPGRLTIIYAIWLVAVPLGCIAASGLGRIIEAGKQVK